MIGVKSNYNFIWINHFPLSLNFKESQRATVKVAGFRDRFQLPEIYLPIEIRPEDRNDMSPITRNDVKSRDDNDSSCVQARSRHMSSINSCALLLSSRAREDHEATKERTKKKNKNKRQSNSATGAMAPVRINTFFFF